MAENRKYKKLRAASGSGLVATHALWIGDDHLLAVTNTYGMESYKKYYFGEIQAIVAHKTASWLIGNIILAVVDACFLVPALILAARDGASPGAITLFVFAGILSIIFILHLLGGSTGKICIQTATSYDRIEGVQRMRLARKIIHRITPLVQAAQQNLAQAAVPAPAGTAETPSAP